MITIEQIIRGQAETASYDSNIYYQIKRNWDAIAKPLDSMGVFEEFIARIGAIQGAVMLDVKKSAVIIMCADNGIVAEGISQSDQSVTAVCAGNIAKRQTAVGNMAKASETEIIPVDIGINCDDTIPGVRSCKVRAGTRDFLKEPAMTREETFQAIQTGMDMAAECKRSGYGILGTGEMGIGNTTTSSAVAAALLACDARIVTGRGAGLDDSRLEHKIMVIQRALELYSFIAEDTIGILSTVGGLDIAGLTGIFLGGALYKIPIVLDGVISMVAALLAERLLPGAKAYMIPSHISREPAAKLIMKELQLRPVIDGNMALGEGTGAVMMISLLKMAAEVYRNGNSFTNAGVEQYVRYEGNNR